MDIAVVHDAPLPPHACRRLLDAIKRRGHRGIYVSLRRIGAWIGGGPRFIVGNRSFLPNAVLLRSFGLSISVEQFLARIGFFMHMELYGIKVVNSTQALFITRNKYLTLAILEKEGLPVPRTFISENLGSALTAVKGLGEVVVKPIMGSRGYGSVKVSDPDVAFEVMKTLLEFRKPLYVQEYLEKPGRDIRAFVVGGEVVASMYRYAAPGSWKTNIAQGGRGEKCTLPPEYREIAVKAAECLKLGYAGVDIVETKEGPVIVEVNGSPDFEELCKVTGVDVPLAIVKYVEEEVKR
ncbi:MAG: RimK family alpha-L-glutamate ligase [Thermoprotei archaeon]|nr:MAG: RimK family alpha-L-glutamate ligase [Thermoprotei archaeon]